MSWREELENAVKGKKALIVCVGNDMKGDDAVGKLVHDSIVTDEKLYCAEMPENYISKIKEKDPELMLIVDAMHFGGEPGEIFFAKAEQLQSSGPSTHSLSFTVMSKMLPGIEVYILGVQPKSLEFGEKISDDARRGAEQISKALDRITS
jgi:hydrogenase 3 maturation protease